MHRFICFCSIFLAASAYSEDWEWSLTPYLWVVDVELDTGLEVASGGTTTFNDIVDKLDFAALVHFEGRKDRLGFLVDIVNMQLSDRKTQGPIQVDTDTNISVIEGAAIVALSDEPQRTELLFGFRSIVGELDVEFKTAGGFIRREIEDSTLVDAMIGIRHIKPLSDKWTLSVRGDVATGDSDFAWNVQVRVGRHFDSGTLELVYRYLNMEADLGALEPEITLFGPVIGYTFHF